MINTKILVLLVTFVFSSLTFEQCRWCYLL